MPTVAEVWAAKFKDYLPDANGERPFRTAADMLWSARRDAALSLRLCEQIASKVDIGPEELAAIATAADEAFDETAVADAVLAGLADRSAQDMAAALRAVLSPDQVTALITELSG